MKSRLVKIVLAVMLLFVLGSAAPGVAAPVAQPEMAAVDLGAGPHTLLADPVGGGGSGL